MADPWESDPVVSYPGGTENPQNPTPALPVRQDQMDSPIPTQLLQKGDEILRRVETGEPPVAPWENDPAAGAEAAPPADEGFLGKADRILSETPIVGAHYRAGKAIGDMLTDPSKWTGAAESIGNDLNAGFQGVNPVATQEAAQSGQAIGTLVQTPGMRPYIAMFDGTMAALKDFPADRYVTTSVEGTTYVVPRNATDSAGEGIEESPLASLGRLFGYGIPTGVPEAARAVAAPTKAVGERQAAAQAAQDLGITPSAGMMGTVRGKVAAAGEQFAPTAGPFRRDAERVTEEIAGAAGKIADAAGPGVSPFDAGSALQEGGRTYVQGVRDTQGKLFDAVDQAIPRDTRIGTPETRDYILQEVSRLAETPNIARSVGTGKLQGWLEDLAAVEPKGGLTWDAARSLRSQIGETIGDIKGPERDIATGKLKAIYGRLTDDLKAAAEAAGPQASYAWTRAQKYTKASEGRIEQAFSKVLKADTPERAYSILTGYATEGSGQANINALNRVFMSLPKEDRAVVSGTIIRRLGRATAGTQDAAGEAFSPATFLTNWNRMSPEARATIARGGMDPGVPDQLTKLAKVADQWKKAGLDKNHSNTGGTVGQIGLWTGFFASLFTGNLGTAAGIAGGAGAANLSARAMTYEPFLKALNRIAATGEASAMQRLATSPDVPREIAMEAATVLRLAAPEASSPQSQPREPATASGS